MAENLSKHPILTYITFVLPMILLALCIVFEANVFLIILTLAWLGTALVVLFLPMAKDREISG